MSVDRRNAELTGTVGGTDPGYDTNGRPVNHTWKNGAGTALVGYRYQYNGPNGVGTNQPVSELRTGLFGQGPGPQHLDTYGLDSAYRQTSFTRNTTIPSLRLLDGANKMRSFLDEGVNRNPVVDGVPAEAGLNQYSSFGAAARTYTLNGALASDGLLTYWYDCSDRLMEVRNQSTAAFPHFRLTPEA